jgi:DNA-nicking Smr family endonuclease
LDLHGLTQAAAHKKLRETVVRAYARNLRCILVITGKGRGQDGGIGVLKKQVPLWLQESDLRPIVLKVEPAQPAHGGAGALYVLLRRTRTNKNQ